MCVALHQRNSVVVAISMITAIVRVIVSSNPAVAQPAQGRIILTSISGEVVFSPAKTKSMYPAAGVEITILDSSGHKVKSLKSTDSGRFDFGYINQGQYTVSTSKATLQSLHFPVFVNLTSSKPLWPEPALLIEMRASDDPAHGSVHVIANNGLRLEILKRTEQDQAVRQEMIKSGMDHPDRAILAKMAHIDADNLARMKGIVKLIGWPGRGQIGADGTDAAFLLVQHAEYDFQKQMLPIVEKAFRAGELPGQDYALLKDRVLMKEGKKQIYGTQANPVSQWKGHEPTMYPIEDEANVDKRRAEVGLMPLAEYITMMRKMYFP